MPKTASQDEDKRSILEIVLKSLGVRRSLRWGSADASSAKRLVRVGDRVVPDRIDVDFPGADGQPYLRMEMAVVDGVPQCRELRLSSVEGGRDVRGLDLRAIRLSEWVDDIFAEFAMESIPGGVSKSDDPRQVMGAAAEFQRARRGKGARSIGPDLIRRAAEVYTEHFTDRPIPAVAAAFGVSERTASGYITLARHEPYNYLPETTRGKKAK